MKSNLGRCHPSPAPDTIDLMEWVVVTLHDENNKWGSKKIAMVMKPKIALKVALVVDNEGASFSEAPLGRSDWECKPEEDARSAESAFSGDHDSSSSIESSESSEDGNSSFSSSSSSSSTSSSGVEVLPKTKGVPGKGTKRPIITP